MFSKLKNSIVGKIMMGYAAIILLAFITTLVSMYTAWQNRNIDKRVSEAYYPMVLSLKETEMLASESYKLINNWVYQPNVQEKEKLKQIHEKQVSAKKENLLKITQQFENASDATEAHSIISGMDLLVAAQVPVMETLSNDEAYADDLKVDEALTALDKKITPAYKALTEQINKVSARQNQLLEAAKQQKENSATILSYLYVSNIILFLVIGIYAFFFSKNSITKPISGLSELISTLSKGKFVSVTLKKGRDEIGRMAEAIESMLTGLKAKVEFAENIGKGNYDSKFELLSEDDTMGDALIQMRSNLKQAAEDDRKRNWATEGLAKFADILRSRNDNLSELSDNITSNLVKYMNANQGALFLINDDNQNDSFIELVACYAYNRKKYLNKRIELGEGITGQCILEKDTIYMSDVPDDYLRITSGLGEALPRNLLIVPLKLDESIFGVVEIASFQIIEPYQIEFVEKLGESIASTISSVKVNSRTKKLLEETQVQAEQMRAQEEEMRQNMEELSATQEEMQRVLQGVQSKEAYLNEVLNSSNDTICTIDKEFKIISYNKAFETQIAASGFHVEKGFDMLALLNGKEREKLKATYLRVLAGEHVELTDSYVLNGVTMHLASSYSPLRNEHGEIQAIASFSKDITDVVEARNKAERLVAEAQQSTEEMKAQEEELRQNMEELSATQEEVQRILDETQNKERYLNELINVSTDAIFTIDKNFKLQSYNEYFAMRLKKLGITVSAGFNLLDIFQGEEKLQNKANYEKAFAGQTFEHTTVSTINQTEMHLTSSYAPMRNANGEITAIACYTKDVTALTLAQKEAESIKQELEQRESVFTITTILSESDQDGNIIFVNNKLCEVSGYSRQELIGKPHNIFRHEEMPKEFFTTFWQTIKKGEIFKGLIKNKAKDGTHYWVDATVMPVKNQAGEIKKYIAACYHITDDTMARALYNLQAKKLKLPLMKDTLTLAQQN
ncbi:MAG: PAS domain S-box protein [Cytophagales bacterium]|nr:PAS domain S-box protein [Cytophagales bacterium]HRE67687.1 PAS domain S-box protein [Cyclobacteriaceae bacterium]HRG09927.1 PAS domain S-box protein [Cyclobacteriaceae bacterium]